MGKSIDSYVAALHTLSKMGNYGLLLNSLIRDRIVIGISDNGTRKLLIQVQEVTLTRCIGNCRSNKATTFKIQAMSNQEDLKFFSDGKSKGKTSGNMNPNDKG